jgi:hypothetical protein
MDVFSSGFLLNNNAYQMQDNSEVAGLVDIVEGWEQTCFELAPNVHFLSLLVPNPGLFNLGHCMVTV